jgi:hypothetical protein
MNIKKKNFANNTERGEKIKAKLKEKVGKPIIAFGYFNSMSELKEALGVSNTEINKANAREGAVRGFSIIKTDVSKALTKVVELKQYK